MTTDPARAAAVADFLAATPWAGAARAALAGDASNRRYERLSHPTAGAAVLMDAPPDRGEDVRPFADITGRLRGAGLSAPAIHACDPDRGFLLLEDLGDAVFARVLERSAGMEDALYAAAVDLLAGLSARPDLAEGLPPYDADRLRAEAALALDWYLPAATGGAAADRDAFLDLVTEACAPALSGPRVLTLRDYHAENLLWLPDRAGAARVGLLDYQDALAGHPAYDLVSLLEDARRDTAPALRTAMIARFAAHRPVPGLAEAYAALGAQRNLKILGIFARLWLRDGKPGYLDLLPRVWNHLQNDLAHPRLAALRARVQASLPPPDTGVRARIRGAR